MVMHYLLHENRLPETGSCFDLVLNQHMPEEYAIQKAYNMTSAQLEQAVKDYFHSQAALIGALSSVQKSSDHPANSANIEPAYRFPTPVGPDDSAIIAKPLPEDDARALYAEVQIRIPERRDLGLKELQALATAPTLADKKAAARAESTQKKSDDENADQLPTTAVGNALAHRILAWDHIQQGEFDEALTELGDTAALNRNDVWVRYYLSVLKYRMAQARHSGMQGLANMMLDLRTVLEWYPEFAAAYDLLALARNEGGGPAAAMQAERAAMSLSPRDERYVYHMAQIYIASKRWESAETLLERLRSSANPEMVSLARERLSEIGNERKYGMAVPGAAGTQTQLTPQKTPFDVLDEDAARRAAQEKAAQSGGAGDRRPTKFLKGRLVAVDCSTAPAAILTVTAEGIALKLRAADYKSLLLIGADQFSCAWQDREVSVNYKPGGLADGDLVSLEVR
jgi:Flp pilus assembly protein TadD